MGGCADVLSPRYLRCSGRLTNPLCCCALRLVAFAVIGFIDDYAKVSKQRNLGLTAKKKIYFQVWSA